MPDNFFPILDEKREKEFAEKYKQPECKKIQMTTEQLQYYKSLPYVEATKFLNRIMKGEKPIMNKIEPKITREQLIQECKEHGTGKEAVEAIAQKYNLKESTVKFYISNWEIRMELPQTKKGEEPIMQNNERQSKDVQRKEEIQQAQQVKKGLHVILRILKSENGVYKIFGNTIRISEINGKKLRNSILLDKSILKPFITELREIDEIINKQEI